jgi:hypothetical protein
MFLLLKLFMVYCGRMQQGVSYDLVDQTQLPADPTALIVHDERGRKKWTVWVPPSSSFPLRPWQYTEICAQADEVQQDLRGRKALFGAKHHRYYANDPHFVQVSEALSSGLLPKPAGHIANAVLDHRSTCTRSLTFVMETSEAGMGPSLLALWAAYGLAMKEKRAFFLDDSKWCVGP